MCAKFELFRENFNKAMADIERYRANPDMAVLVEWLLTTEANPYSYLDEAWAGSTTSAEGFASLLHQLSHALFDDGDITFVTINKSPRIVFACQYDINFNEIALHSFERRRPFPVDIVILDIDAPAFCAMQDAYELAEVKRCFLADAKRQGIEFAAKHYSKSKFFDSKWAEEIRP